MNIFNDILMMNIFVWHIVQINFILLKFKTLIKLKIFTFTI